VLSVADVFDEVTSEIFLLSLSDYIVEIGISMISHTVGDISTSGLGGHVAISSCHSEQQ